jgi:MFS family permease
MWLASNSFGYLIAVQACAGAAWAAFDLATLLLFFQTISAEKRVGVLTFFNFANAAAIVAGSAVGGIVLAACNSSREAYLTLFVLSTAARAAALLLLVRLPQHVAVAPQPARPAAPAVLPQPASRQGRLAAGSPLRGPHWTRSVPASRPADQPACHLPG